MSQKRTTKLDALAPPVERPRSKRGRKQVVVPAFVELGKAWDRIPVGQDRMVPGTAELTSHEELTLARHHLKKHLREFGISKDQYETFAMPDGGLGFTKRS